MKRPLSMIKPPNDPGEPQPNCSLLNLCYPALMHLLSFFSPQDIGKLRLSCRMLRYFVDDNHLLMRYVDVIFTDVKRRQVDNESYQFFKKNDFHIHIAHHKSKKYMKSLKCEGKDNTSVAIGEVIETIRDPYVMVGRVLINEMSLNKVKAHHISSFLERLPRYKAIEFDSVYFNNLDVDDLDAIIECAKDRSMKFDDCVCDPAIAKEMKSAFSALRRLRINHFNFSSGNMDLLILENNNVAPVPFDLSDLSVLGFVSYGLYNGPNRATKSDAWNVARNAMQLKKEIDVRLRAVDVASNAIEARLLQPPPVEKYSKSGRTIAINLTAIPGQEWYWDITTRKEFPSNHFPFL